MATDDVERVAQFIKNSDWAFASGAMAFDWKGIAREAKECVLALQAQLDTANGTIGEMSNTPAGAQIAALRGQLAESEQLADARTELDRLKQFAPTKALTLQTMDRNDSLEGVIEEARGTIAHQEQQIAALWAGQRQQKMLHDAACNGMEAEIASLKAEVDSLREENRGLVEQRKEPTK